MRARLLVPATISMAALVVLPGCGIPSEDSPRAIPSESVSPSGSSPSPSPSPLRGRTEQVQVFFVQDSQLAPVFRLVTQEPGPDTLLQALLQGPDTQEKTENYLSVAFADATADERVPPDGIVTVTLPPVKESSAEQNTADEINGYAQIVLTLTDDDDVRGVVFERDKMPLPVPDADGQLSKEGQPVTAADYRSLVQEEPK